MVVVGDIHFQGSHLEIGSRRLCRRYCAALAQLSTIILAHVFDVCITYIMCIVAKSFKTYVFITKKFVRLKKKYPPTPTGRLPCNNLFIRMQVVSAPGFRFKLQCMGWPAGLWVSVWRHVVSTNSFSCNDDLSQS